MHLHKSKVLPLFILLLFLFSGLQGHTAERQTTVHKLSTSSAASGSRNDIVHLPNETLSVQWHKRSNSLGQNYRTLVGYHGNALVGTLAIHADSVSGVIYHRGKEYKLHLHRGKLIASADTAALGTCGTCEDDHRVCSGNLPATPAKAMRRHNNSPTTDNPTHEIYSDGILRVYRLALLVDYSAFVHYFGSDRERVKAFWANTEVFLNELYLRDVGIKFQVINNDRLIVSEESGELYRGLRSSTIIESSTKAINELIGNQSYDIGVSIAQLSSGEGRNGVAGMYHAFNENYKAHVFAIPRATTIAHELGHMFGSDHTFTFGGDLSMKTEPGYGQSIMSYNHSMPRDFFSLPSLFYIREAFVNKADYYPTTDRSEKIGPGNSGNPVYGIDTRNRPPVIDRSRLKPGYTIPWNTSFQFHIKAADPDGDRLLYTAHQADFRRHNSPSNAIVRSIKSSEKNTIAFEPTFDRNDWLRINHDTPPTNTRGSYLFWLGVNDAPATPDENRPHSTRYDMYGTEVKIVEGMPFQITSPVLPRYMAGQRVPITWSVDEQIFSGYNKVRILLSDDFGENYRYVLAEEADNDGEHEVIIPQIEVGRMTHNGYSWGKGVFKIEVIGHIAHAISGGGLRQGFEVIKSPIAFTDLPAHTVTTTPDAVPPMPVLTATSSDCSTPQANIVPEQTETEKRITRTWTATDGCGNETAFVQHIYLEKAVEPLRFEGTLPANQIFQCPSELTPAPVLTVQGGSAPTVRHFETRIRGDYEQYTYHRTWIATDANAMPISHTQLITIYDTQKPKLSVYPRDTVVRDQFDILTSRPVITATDNCSATPVVSTTEQWFSEGGQLKALQRWTATDNVGNKTIHERLVTVDPNLSTSLTQTETAPVALSPNPATTEVRLNTAGHLAIYNATGLLMYENDRYAGNTPIPIDRWDKGVYLVKMNGNTLKLVKR